MAPKVLIVEDDLSTSVSLQFLMNQCGYVTLTATSGEGAIEAVMKFHPDIILLDVMLPGINGYEVCETVRLNPEWRSIKIIFLSALGNDENIVKGRSLGADDYITKPYSNKTVVAKVKKLLADSASHSLRERPFRETIR